MTEELIEYIFCCVVYKHKNDNSPRITKEATEKENILFYQAIEQIKKMDKDHRIFIKE